MLSYPERVSSPSRRRVLMSDRRASIPLPPLVNYGLPVAYTTEHYVDWPPRSSPI